ncbi:hypothetical protein PSEUDO8BK_10029 [Pseudomonas sp. 8BK]|nr:hypothetical protein PSEUDO8BK_10029 [Pseudomonas sp. 8BK]
MLSCCGSTWVRCWVMPLLSVSCRESASQSVACAALLVATGGLACRVETPLAPWLAAWLAGAAVLWLGAGDLPLWLSFDAAWVGFGCSRSAESTTPRTPPTMAVATAAVIQRFDMRLLH